MTTEIVALAELVEPAVVPRVCRDPGDDHVLAAGLEGRVEMIVTGDRDLLDLEAYQGIAIRHGLSGLRALSIFDM